MDALIWMGLGAAGVVVAIGCYTASRKGWDYVQTWLRQRATSAEAKLKQQFSGAIGDLDAKIRDVVHSEIAKLESDIAALKTKVGGLS